MKNMESHKLVLAQSSKKILIIQLKQSPRDIWRPKNNSQKTNLLLISILRQHEQFHNADSHWKNGLDFLTYLIFSAKADTKPLNLDPKGLIFTVASC